MALLSPGIETKESTFYNIIAQTATGVGAIVGRFTKGPVDTPILIDKEDTLYNVFGGPTESNYLEWFTAAQFLQYTNQLWAVRTSPTGAANSYAATGSVTTPPTYGNQDQFNSASVDANVKVIRRELGAYGNNLGFIIVDSTSWSAFNTWVSALVTAGTMSNAQSYVNALQYQPGTTAYVAKYAGASKNDEVHVIVFDATGLITGTQYQILEIYQGLSKASDALDYQGNSIYYPNVLNVKSSNVWIGSNLGTSANGTTTLQVGSTTTQVSGSGVSFAPFNFSFTTPISTSPSTVSFGAILTGGADGSAGSESNVTTSYNIFSNTDLYNVNLFPTAGYYQTTTLQGIVNVVYSRKDSLAFLSPVVSGTNAVITDRSATAVTDMIAWKNSLNIADTYSSYTVYDTGYKYIYDKYNNKYRWIPLNGDIAGLCAQVDKLADAWYSPGGYNRGGIKNVIKLAFNPTQTQRDVLYPQSINPVVAFPGQGVVLFGDRTGGLKPSAFREIGIRRLFNVLEKSVSVAAKYQLFEFNDSYTQTAFKNMVVPFLRSIQGRRGIQDFLVVCDSSNNTPYIVDSNQFIGSIYVKPNHSINFITLNFVAVGTEVSFSTVVGQ